MLYLISLLLMDIKFSLVFCYYKQRSRNDLICWSFYTYMFEDICRRGIAESVGMCKK